MESTFENAIGPTTPWYTRNIAAVAQFKTEAIWSPICRPRTYPLDDAAEPQHVHTGLFESPW